MIIKRLPNDTTDVNLTETELLIVISALYSAASTYEESAASLDASPLDHQRVVDQLRRQVADVRTLAEHLEAC